MEANLVAADSAFSFATAESQIHELGSKDRGEPWVAIVLDLNYSRTPQSMIDSDVRKAFRLIKSISRAEWYTEIVERSAHLVRIALFVPRSEAQVARMDAWETVVLGR